jgi:hypothetical protein
MEYNKAKINTPDQKAVQAIQHSNSTLEPPKSYILHQNRNEQLKTNTNSKRHDSKAPQQGFYVENYTANARKKPSRSQHQE